jgi:hypothetical protein
MAGEAIGVAVPEVRAEDGVEVGAHDRVEGRVEWYWFGGSCFSCTCGS